MHTISQKKSKKRAKKKGKKRAKNVKKGKILEDLGKNVQIDNRMQ